MSKNPKKRWAVQIGAILLSVAFALTVSELVVRRLFPEAVVSPDPLIEGSEKIRYRTKPYLDGTFKFTNYYQLRTNGKGLREAEEIPYKSPRDEIRVLCLGDSFTFGLGVNDGEDCVRAAETAVRKTLGDKVRFINMGISSAGPSVEYLHFLEEGRRYRPAAVVVQVCDNDLFDDHRDNVFRLVEGRLVRNPDPRPRTEKYGVFPAYQWVTLHLAIFNLCRNFARKSAGIEKSWEEMKSDVYGGSARVSRAVWVALIDAIRQERAVPFFLLADNHVKALEEPRTRTFRLVEELCREKQVSIINPRSEIEAAFGERLVDAYVSSGDHHWGREGNRIVGKVVANALMPILKQAMNSVTDIGRPGQ